ncbi:internal (core) protein [Enterobacter phage 01_vB_Eclo_IJM]|nr:internal (core) protein [Enterobacter phage 01_vB_Eclo_IJM]
MSLRDVFNPTRWNNHKWSREELDQIRNAGVLPQYYGLSLAAPLRT